MPDASNRAVFESSVARYFYSTIQEFKRIDTGAIAALGTSTSWHLPQFAWVGAGDGVRLGIADSGIDLSRAQVTLESFRSFDYGNGAITGSTPKDYASTWHGSQVTSFACGHHEGVAPEASCCVAAVLTENNGRNGSVVQIAAGLDWLGRQGVDVVNCSFGSDEYDPAWYQMIVNLRALGVVVVAGIGNEGVPLFPGCFHNVVAVGARDSSGNNASWSATGPAVDGYGNELPRMKPDLWLPGVDLEGQVRDGLVTGTSYASPLATGALATRLAGQSGLPEDSWDLVAIVEQAIADQDEDEQEESEATTSTTDSEEGEEDMAKDATSVEVSPEIDGFRIEDPDGELVGVLVGGMIANTWIFETGKEWPNKVLHLFVIEEGDPIPTISDPRVWVALPAFEDLAGGGTVDVTTVLDGNGVPQPRNTRYLIKTATDLQTLGFLAVRKDLPGSSAEEFGHPADDGRLPAYQANPQLPQKRYLPAEALVLQPRGPSFVPPWTSHRRVIV